MTKEIVNLYCKKGLSLRAIATKLNTSHFTVKKILVKEGVQLRVKGQKKNCAPWNKGQTNEVKKLQYTLNVIENNGFKKFKNENTIRYHAKRYLKHKFGHKCSICGIAMWNKMPVPLVCDHIDGDHSNDSLENFRLVCCNCDAQLPTFKSKNMGCKKRKFNGRLPESGLLALS